jgi:hypothetical protein
MNRNQDALPGRTDKLIPLSRKVFGDKMVIHADANKFLRSARSHPGGPDAGGHQSQPLRRTVPLRQFRCDKEGRRHPFDTGCFGRTGIQPVAFSVVYPQPRRRRHPARPILLWWSDSFPPGGPPGRIGRRLATTVHLSGGFGFVYSLHFASCTAKIGAWHKKGVETYGQWFNPPLHIVDGAITVPKDPGLGPAAAREILKGATPVQKTGLPWLRILRVKARLAVQMAMLSLRAQQHCIGKLVSVLLALLLVLFSMAAARFANSRLRERRTSTMGLRPVKLMWPLRSDFAIERNAFRIPLADGT